MTTETVILAGNNLAVLIGALELSRQGQNVSLFTDGQRPGGHFGGVSFDDHLFDIGMVTIEMVEPKIFDQDLHTYDPGIRNDWTRFADKSNAWLEANANLELAPTTHCLVEGQEIPDYLLTNRLDGLANFSIMPPDLLPADDVRHPKNKTSTGAYDSLDYRAASIACHGTEFHNRFIEPYVEKLAGCSSESLVARYHRGIWAPIYYPETLRQALLDEPISLPEYPFWSTDAGGIHEFVHSVFGELESSAFVTIDKNPIEKITPSEAGTNIRTCFSSIDGVSAAFGLTPARYAELFGLGPTPEIDALQLTVLFARVHRDWLIQRPACIMVADRDFASYRYTDQDAFANQDPEWHRVALEASSKTLMRTYPDMTLEAAMHAELIRILRGPQNDNLLPDNAIEIARCVTAKNALIIPTKRSVSELGAMSRAFKDVAPNAQLTGSLLGYGVTSMNDQIVQGLMIADQYGAGGAHKAV